MKWRTKMRNQFYALLIPTNSVEEIWLLFIYLYAYSLSPKQCWGVGNFSYRLAIISGSLELFTGFSSPALVLAQSQWIWTNTHHNHTSKNTTNCGQFTNSYLLHKSCAPFLTKVLHHMINPFWFCGAVA